MNATGQTAKTEEDFYALLSESTRDELKAKLPESVTGLVGDVLNALQEYGEEMETEMGLLGEEGEEKATLGDFSMFINLSEDTEGTEDEDD